MKIVVATKNPQKIQAVREVLADYSFFHHAKIRSNPAPSGVREQPLTLDETVLGAYNRAVQAFNHCDYSVGIESGQITTHYGTRTKHLNITACIIYDGTEDYLGTSAGFEQSTEMTRLMHEEGLDVNQAAYKTGLTTHPRIGYAEGLISILTEGRINRKDYTKPAVIMAVTRLLNKEKGIH